MRLIDAEALSARFAAMQECATMRDHVYLMGVLSVIDNAPIIDAVPVVHGRWIDDRTDIVCSVCKVAYSDEIAFMNRNFECENLKYCPDCGAQMDGGAE